MGKINKYTQSVNKINPRARIRFWVWLIIILTVAAGIFVYPPVFNKGVNFLNEKLGLVIPSIPENPFHLGLDLQGGTHLVYEANVSEIPEGEKTEAIEGVRDVIERRVNLFGIAEPLVQWNKVGNSYRIIVELAGVKDVTQAIDMIGETPLLEFKEEYTGEEELTEGQINEIQEYNQQAEITAQDVLNEVKSDPDNFSANIEKYSEDPMYPNGNMDYVTEQIDSDIFSAAQQIDEGQIYNDLIESDLGYSIIKKGIFLEEKQIKASHILICYKDAERCTVEISKEEALNKINELKQQVNPENFTDMAKENSNEPNADVSGGDLGFFKKGNMVPEFEEVAFSLQTGEISDVLETQFGYHLIYKTDEKSFDSFNISRILIKKKTKDDFIPPDRFKNTDLSGKHLAKAQLEMDPQTNQVNVGIEFNDEGKELFAEITERNVNKRVGIYLDGSPISVPTVSEPIKEGKAIITGKFTSEEAKTLVRRLNSGALPVPITLLSQQTVGASLGQESLQVSLWAGLLGVLLVMIFMIAYYRSPGVIASIALIIYGILVMAVFKSIPVTLTLSGIAGFILSIGMAVDANVLIFERTREELSMGKPLGTSIDEGFRRAWSSIRDGNISTLITCFVLIWFGTGLIKGFAITLSIGVVFSMLSAVLITRVWLKLAAGWKPFSEPSRFYLYKKTKTE